MKRFLGFGLGALPTSSRPFEHRPARATSGLRNPQSTVNADFGKTRYAEWPPSPPVHHHSQPKLASTPLLPAGHLILTVEDAVGEASVEPHKAIRPRGNEVSLERQRHIGGIPDVRRLRRDRQRSTANTVQK
jgi:hypothetical protein